MFSQKLIQVLRGFFVGKFSKMFDPFNIFNYYHGDRK